MSDLLKPSTLAAPVVGLLLGTALATALVCGLAAYIAIARVGNRPPVARLAPGFQPVAHRYDVASGSYQAGAALAVFEDPDGDPLDPGGSSGDEACGAFSLVDGVASVACVRPFAATLVAYPTLSGFAGPHALVPRASDGWASVAVPVTLQVGTLTRDFRPRWASGTKKPVAKVV